jgi:hypothetical protein
MYVRDYGVLIVAVSIRYRGDERCIGLVLARQPFGMPKRGNKVSKLMVMGRHRKESRTHVANVSPGALQGEGKQRSTI